MATPTTVQETQYGFADQLAPYAETLLGQAAALTDTSQNPYMQYQKTRQAQFTPLQKQAFESAALQAPAYQNTSATDLATLASEKALGAGYSPSNFQSSTVQGPQINQYQMQGPKDVGANNFTDAGIASLYMNPYQQQVTDIQKREAIRQAGTASTQRGAQAAGAGAFGGSRQAIMDAEAQRNLGTQLNDIQAQGSNAAYGQGMAQFNADQARQLQAGMGNQQMGFNVGNTNLQAQLGTQQLGTGQNMQAQLANQQSRNAMNQLNEQSSQYGAGFGLQGAQAALQGANTLGQLGQNQYNQETGITNMQNQYGTQQQGQVQTGLNNEYQDYLNAQNYPYKQLGFMSDMLRGLPLTANSSSIYQAAPSMVSQAAGLGTAALGASQLMRANGGMIKSNYADGGAVAPPMYTHAFDNGSGFARGGRVKGAGLADLALSRMA